MRLVTWIAIVVLLATACSSSTTDSLEQPASEPVSAGEADHLGQAGDPPELPTPGPACCVTQVHVSWSATGDAQPPEAWDFDVTTSCGSAPNDLSITTEGKRTADATAVIGSNGAFDCEITITWQAIDDWEPTDGPERTIVGFANNTEFDIVTFEFLPVT